MNTTALRPLFFAGAMLAAALAAPTAAHADWRGRGHGWGPPARHWAPPPYYGHRHHGWNGAPVVGAIIGLGAGLAIGSALAAPPPPPAYYVPPPPPPAYYVPPAPPVYYAPAPDYYAPSKW
jgi:hypothetical protein